MVIIVASTQFDATSEDLTWNLVTIVVWASVEVNLVTVSSMYQSIITGILLTVLSLPAYRPPRDPVSFHLHQPDIDHRFRFKQLRTQLRPQSDQEHD